MTGRERTLGRRRCLALALVALAACEGGAQNPRSAVPVSTKAGSASATGLAMSPADHSGRIDWPVPAGWDHESIPFPFDFAPSLPYRGVEELRFAPGFYQPNQPGYWSYDIVWWLTEKPQFDSATIEAALTVDFRGFSLSVGRGKFRVEPSLYHAELVADGASRQLTGQIRRVDAFTTGLPITLNAVIAVRECVKARRHAVTFMLSPRDRNDRIWRNLQATAAGLVCE